jgi:hypothetical protein
VPVKKVIGIAVEVAGKERVIVTTYETGEVTSAPVVKTKPTRKPRLRRQRLIDRTRKKQI